MMHLQIQLWQQTPSGIKKQFLFFTLENTLTHCLDFCYKQTKKEMSLARFFYFLLKKTLNSGKTLTSENNLHKDFFIYTILFRLLFFFFCVHFPFKNTYANFYLSFFVSGKRCMYVCTERTESIVSIKIYIFWLH